MASPAAIQHHYDVAGDFYRVWLDPTLTYSCALWSEEGQTLEDAQLAKLDYFVDELTTAQTARILDIGCGWGSFLERARRRQRVQQAVGLTLSRSQAATIPSVDGIEIRLESWHEHRTSDPYDAVVSIGSFEHVARPGSDAAERAATYRSFFAATHELLASGGRLGLQTIAHDGDHEDLSSTIGEFFSTSIFPESSLPTLSEIVEASRESFRLCHLRIDPEHYARTCREWRRRLLTRRSEALAAADDETVRRYSKYLLLAEIQFAKGNWTLYRFIFERR